MADARDNAFALFSEIHSEQLNASGVPSELWFELYRKFNEKIFDAREYFDIVSKQLDDGKTTNSVVARQDLHVTNNQNVFLIDNLLSFESGDVQKKIESKEGLLQRLVKLFGIDGETSRQKSPEKKSRYHDSVLMKMLGEVGEGGRPRSADSLPSQRSVDACSETSSVGSANKLKTDIVLKELWKNAITFSVTVQERTRLENKSVWYVMNEFGARIRHSFTPNVRIVPIIFSPEGQCYSVMYMTKEVLKDGEITRNFAENIVIGKDPLWREYLELPWAHCDFSSECSLPPPPSDDFFLSEKSFYELAMLLDEETANPADPTPRPNMKTRKLKIWSDDTNFINHLHRAYELSEWKVSDVLWTRKSFHNYGELRKTNPHALVNHFPYESRLIVMDYFVACAMEDHVRNDWYQLTYNLDTQLPQFVARYQQKEKSGEKYNVWIVKPWNSERGIKTCITGDLNEIIRLVETGTKIVSEYISRPVLYLRPDNGNRVKFNLKYIVLVKTFRPVTAYVYNTFLIQLAYNKFSMENFEDADTHFPVLKYDKDQANFSTLKCVCFAKNIEQTYKNLKWSDIQSGIHSIIRKALEAASKNDPPKGVASNGQSRAMYGVDIMLQYGENDQIKPTILKFNYMPNYTLFCKFHPDFTDTVFNTLFLEEVDLTKVTEI